MPPEVVIQRICPRSSAGRRCLGGEVGRQRCGAAQWLQDTVPGTAVGSPHPTLGWPQLPGGAGMSASWSSRRLEGLAQAGGPRGCLCGPDTYSPWAPWVLSAHPPRPDRALWVRPPCLPTLGAKPVWLLLTKGSQTLILGGGGVGVLGCWRGLRTRCPWCEWSVRAQDQPHPPRAQHPGDHRALMSSCRLFEGLRR